MRDLYKIIDKLVEKKYMTRFAAWPGGNVHLGIYPNIKQDDQYLYDGKIDDVERELIKDFGHLLNTLPIPPGFPRP